MSTGTLPQETTTATVTPKTSPIEFASMLYGPPVAPVLPTPAPASPAPPDSGPTATPPASAVSSEVATPAQPAVADAASGSKTPTEPVDKETGHMAAARRLGQEVSELKKGLAMLTEENRTLKAKQDGTYQDPPQPTEAQIAEYAEFRGRETASRAVAEGTFGVEAVQTQIYGDDAPFRALVDKHPWLYQRVRHNPQPAVEAMRVLKEQAFIERYGDDATQWVAKIEHELKPRWTQEFKAQQPVSVVGTVAPTVTGARGSGGVKPEKSIQDLFYGTHK